MWNNEVIGFVVIYLVLGGSLALGSQTKDFVFFLSVVLVWPIWTVYALAFKLGKWLGKY